MRERRLDLAMRVAGYALIGLPLILVPFAVNSWHALRYVDTLMSMVSPPSNILDTTDIRYFTTFDVGNFQNPFASEPGSNSFWTIQYNTLHNDYDRVWTNDGYQE